MGLKKLEYSTLGDLLEHEQISQEDPDTLKIIRSLRHVKVDKELSRREFLDICRWKSPRSIRQCRRNSARSVDSMCRKALTTHSEEKRLELLTSLYGVSVPTASAILTLTNPVRYGVIDIRVWQLLYRLGSVTKNPRGQGFSTEDWLQYLTILRYHARRLRVPVRSVELTLFKYHQDHQRGTLYKTLSLSGRSLSDALYCESSNSRVANGPPRGEARRMNPSATPTGIVSDSLPEEPCELLLTVRDRVNQERRIPL